MRPNNKQVEFERINPACTTPMIQVKNTGSNTISSLEIEYTVQGGTPLTYTWSGTILSNETTEIVLPVESMTFWDTALDDHIFAARILTVNGSTDEQPVNDFGQSTFTPARIFDYDDPLEIQVNTNLVPSDNSYLIKDAEGNIVMERDNLASNTQYKDALDLPAGCYTMEFEDTGNDGLSFWFFPNNGNGSLRFNRIINGTIALSVQSFNADFGGGVQFDFVMPQLVSTEDLDTYRLFSVFPNPTFDNVNIELHGFENDILTMELTDLTGRVLVSKTLNNQGINQHIEAVSLEDFAKGMYFLKVSDGERNWVRQVVKQ
jgi:hypothetical protein